ncbi:MAG: helix-turn-helix domain-containing protein [Vicinamibacterales bacterium]
MSELGKIIRDRRQARRWSLRQLGDKVGVTPAYVADIEAARRAPSDQLREKLADALEIPAEDLRAADTRLPGDLRDWIEERPELTAILKSLRSSRDSDILIQRLSRFISRRARTQVPRGFLVTWESELRAIAAEASAWSIETGGDLFGRWHDLPTVLLASKAGPAAQRNNTHFRLDVDYLRQLSEVMATDWALRYFGDWHSHHRLGLSSPSGGDRKRIVGLAGRNRFANMAEIIVTLDDSRGEPLVRIHPWLYDLSGDDATPLSCRVKVLPGLSPLRQALIARKALPEQDLHAWEKITLQRLRIGADSAPPAIEPASDVDSSTRERVLTHVAEALSAASGAAIEQHATGFGSILVATLAEPEYLAFALGSAWPMPVLEVHRMDRSKGSTEVVKSPPNLTALDVAGLVELFRQLKGHRHVEH